MTPRRHATDRTPSTRLRTVSVLVAAFAALGLVACGGDSEPAEAPSAPLTAPEAVDHTTSFRLAAEGSQVDFLMEAPLENIHGRAPNSVQGELAIDLSDLTRSGGLVRIDLFELEVLQQKRESADDAFGAETRSDTQNEHVKAWFEIAEDAPAEDREANRWAEFRIERVSDVSAANVMEMGGAERVVQLTAHGPLRVHQHTVEKSARLELTFTYEGDTATGLRIRTLEPVSVGLDEYDVRPRTAFGTLAQRTLAALGEKVASAAPVTIDVRATPEAAAAE